MNIRYNGYKNERERHNSIIQNGWLFPRGGEDQRLIDEAKMTDNNSPRLKEINERLISIINTNYGNWEMCN